VECFNCSWVAWYLTMQIVQMIIIQAFHYKSSIQQGKTLFTSKLEFNLMDKLLKFYIWFIALHSAKIWHFGK